MRPVGTEFGLLKILSCIPEVCDLVASLLWSVGFALNYDVWLQSKAVKQLRGKLMNFFSSLCPCLIY